MVFAEKRVWRDSKTGRVFCLNVGQNWYFAQELGRGY
jgi:hypothetical protein